MRVLARAVSYPAEVVVSEDGGIYHFTAAFEDIILSDSSSSITEAVEEIVRFLTFWAARKGYSIGVVRDVVETLAAVISTETGDNVKRVYRKLINR